MAIKLKSNPIKDKIVLTECFEVFSYSDSEFQYRLEYDGKLNSIDIDNGLVTFEKLSFNADIVPVGEIDRVVEKVLTSCSLYKKPINEPESNWIKEEDEIELTFYDIQSIYRSLMMKIIDIKEDNKKK